MHAPHFHKELLVLVESCRMGLKVCIRCLKHCRNHASESRTLSSSRLSYLSHGSARAPCRCGRRARLTPLRKQDKGWDGRCYPA